MTGRPRKKPRPINKSDKTKFSIDINEAMRRKIHRHAVRNGRSDGAEIRIRLEASLQAAE